jgi:hypothetical protein
MGDAKWGVTGVYGRSKTLTYREAGMILKYGLMGLVLVGSFAGLAAPVVAASGWLLLMPPEVPGHGEGGKFEVHAPLARWRQVQAFDTARECEEFRLAMLNSLVNEIDRQSAYPLPLPSGPIVFCTLCDWNDKVDIARKSGKQAAHERYLDWKCMPGDAVYQAPK